MKAIKLASIFAVSAVAAAVSTTALAAEPVFTGDAGLKYYFGEGKVNNYGSEGEVNIIGDTGLVYFDLDMESNSITGTDSDGDAATYTDSGFDLDEIYVTVGDIQFGDFDGSLIDSAVNTSSVEEDAENSEDFDNDLAVRYHINDIFTVAIEADEGTDNEYLAASASVPVGEASINFSGGFSENDDLTSYAATIGFSAPVGDTLTFGGYYQEGEKDEVDLSTFGLGADLALTEEVLLSVAYVDTNAEDGQEDTGIWEATVNYTVGDIRYYVTYLDYQLDGKDYGYAGVEASF